jgi:hypothetical protein
MPRLQASAYRALLPCQGSIRHSAVAFESKLIECKLNEHGKRNPVETLFRMEPQI